jgi:hypothetical protein
MRPDPATLADLDVLSTPIAGGPTLLALVDRTRTRAGRDHLRRRLTTPPHEAEAILALQQAHQTLARTPRGIRRSWLASISMGSSATCDRTGNGPTNAAASNGWRAACGVPPGSSSI